MKLPKIPIPAIPDELKEVHDFQSALEAAVVVPEPLVHANIKRALKRNPDATVAELVDDISARYRKRVSFESGAVGVGAAVPGVGTLAATGLTAAELGVFLAESTVYTLTVARLYGVTIKEVDQRKTLVLSSILGEDADRIMSQRLGLSTLTWARSSLSTLTGDRLSGINSWLLKKVLKRTAKKKTGAIFGRLLPFGVGAVIGWYSGKHLASEVIKGLRASLGNPPKELPLGIDVRDGEVEIARTVDDLKDELKRVESQVLDA